MRRLASATRPRPALTPFGAVLLLATVAGTAATAAAAVLTVRVLIPFASACVQACARDPFLMTTARGTAALFVAAAASGLGVGGIVLVRQITATGRLVRRVERLSVSPPLHMTMLASELGLRDRLTYVSDLDPYAFCYGFGSPRVCISSGMVESLSIEELRAVVLHESFHLSRRDPLKVLASRISAGVLYMLPLAADLRDRYLVAKELRADAHVVRESSAQVLAGALLKLCRSGSGHSMAEMATAAVGPFSVMTARIHHLARASEPSMPLRFGRVAATAAVAGLALALTVGSGYAADRSAPAGKSCCVSVTYCDSASGARSNR